MKGGLFRRNVVGALVHAGLRAKGRRKLMGDVPPNPPATPASPKKRILILTYKWWPAHLATESVIGNALKLRGADVSFFTCDAPQDACDNFRMESNRYLLCSQCMYASGKYLDDSGFENLRMSAFLRPEDARAMKAALEPLAGASLETLRAFTYDGIRIGVAAEASTLRYLRVNSLLTRPEESLPVLKGYVRSALRNYFAYRRLFAERRFDLILLQCGKSSSESVMIELAQRNGIPYITYDGGLLGTLIFAVNGSTSDTDVSHIWKRYEGIPLTPEQDRLITERLERWRGGTLSTFNPFPNPKHDAKPIDAETVHARGGNVYLLFTNIAWDTAWTGLRSVFPSMFEWVAETIRFFADRPEHLLIVRIHPAEVQMTRGTTRDRVTDFLRTRFPSMPPNVRIVEAEDPLSSYSLLPHADVVLAYASTIGLEAATMGKPVAILSGIHYAGHGFTMDPATPEEYFSLLLSPDKWRRFDGNRELMSLAKKYAYSVWFRHMIPFRFVRLEGKDYLPRLAFTRYEELAPGRDANLDLICDGILNVRPIFIED